MFWGSDFTLLKTPYKDCVTFMKEIPWLSDRDLDLIMGRAISRWIGDLSHLTGRFAVALPSGLIRRLLVVRACRW